MSEAVWRSLVDVPRDGSVVLLLVKAYSEDDPPEAMAMRWVSESAEAEGGWCLPNWEWYGLEERPGFKESDAILAWMPLPPIAAWDQTLDEARRAHNARIARHEHGTDAPNAQDDV